jgi:SAM-dependent methyltransferase
MFASFLFDPRAAAAKVRAFPHFVRNAVAYRRSQTDAPFVLRLSELRFTSSDRYAGAGSAQGHYFFQDLWAARKLAEWGVQSHVDVGSRIDGFVAHILPFCEVEYVDIRPLDLTLDGLRFVPGSITELPYADGAVRSLSCLHVIEHIGLGRYGDAVDARGPWRGAAELVRVLSPGGRLLFSTPIGRERVVFDAHRIFDPDTVIRMFAPLRLSSFDLIDDTGTGVMRNASFPAARSCDYGCGLFVFEKDDSA